MAPAPQQNPSIDGLYSRNSTRIVMQVTPPSGHAFTVARVQSMREDITNNIQVLDELGSAYAVELKKGITHFTFNVAKFLTRSESFEPLKAGQIFSLNVHDLAASSGEKTIEFFKHCAINTISSSYSVGQAVVALNATIVVAGRGSGFPTGLPSPLA